MNLLVTNTRHAQAYAIIRSLRPYARKVVATTYGGSRLVGALSQAANSRFVDKGYYVPSPVADWRAGNIQRENTEREERYIRAVLTICEREKIDTIFPSWDPHVYVFSKNKDRFERLGVLIPVPDFEAILTTIDKYATAQAAQEVGFPCPKTYLPESDKDLPGIAEEVGFPAIIRPRFTSGGEGMAIVGNVTELREKVRLTQATRGVPMIQEFIPGPRVHGESSFVLVSDKRGDLKTCFLTKRLRTCLRLRNNMAVIHELAPLHPMLADAVRLVQRVGLWGGLSVGTKVDARDGVPKLMEINPRLGSRLWHMTELGINAPLMILKIARGEEVEPVPDNPTGTLFLEPVEDAVQLGFWAMDSLVYKLRTGLLGRAPIDPLNAPTGFKEMFRSIRDTYFLGSRRRLFNPHFRYFFQDPAVSILWWLTVVRRVWSQADRLGK